MKPVTAKRALLLLTLAIAAGSTPVYADSTIIQNKSVTYVNGNTRTDTTTAYYSGSNSNVIELTIGTAYLKIGSSVIKGFGSPSYIQASTGSAMLPLRAVSDAVSSLEQGSEVSVNWQDSTKSATVVFNGNTITFKAGSNLMSVNGKQIKMSAYTEIKDGTTFVPLRALGDALGAEVEWDSSTRTAKLHK
jgi:hypothetical protein